MPIFEYRCKACKAEFEFFKHLSDEKPVCPQCGNKKAKTLEQKVSAGVSHVLKGTGWARDNYANKKRGSDK